MKGLRFLLLGLAVCLASGVKAQFNDSADDIYFYVEYKDGSFVDNGRVLIFNFDGAKAAELSGRFDRLNIWDREATKVNDVKDNLRKSPIYYDEKVETQEYELLYINNNTYQCKSNRSHQGDFAYINFKFSYDRNTLDFLHHYWYTDPLTRLNGYYGWSDKKIIFKKVDKSYFKVGRSRTPNGTMHE